MNILIKSVFLVSFFIYFRSDFVLYTSEGKKTRFQIMKNSLLVLKNNTTCLDCYNSIGRHFRNLKCGKSIIVAVDRKESLFLNALDFKRKITEMNDFTLYFDKYVALDVINAKFGQRSLFTKYNVTKTPCIITCDSSGKIAFWNYQRIFSNGDVSLNDTIALQFSL